MPALAAVPADQPSAARPAASLHEILGVPVVHVDGAFRLLPDRPVCHGRACGCTCRKCDRRPQTAAAPTRQPWQPVVIAGGLA